MAECEQLLNQDLQVIITLFSLLFKKIPKKMFLVLFLKNKSVLISFRNRYFCEWGMLVFFLITKFSAHCRNFRLYLKPIEKRIKVTDDINTQRQLREEHL